MRPGSFAVACLLAAVLLVWYQAGEFRRRSPKGPDASASTRMVPVEVRGPVKRPGIYLFDRAPTIRAVLDRCGAPASLAVPEYLRERRLQPGCRIVVESGGLRLGVGEMDASSRIALGIPLDLNRVDEQDLAAVPGISVRKAQAIVRFRAGVEGRISLERLVKARILSKQRARRVRAYLVP